MKDIKETAKAIIEIAEGIIQTTGGKKIIDSIENQEAKAFIHSIMLITMTNKIIDQLKNKKED